MMFNNIGHKLKILAVVFFCIGIIASVIVGIALIATTVGHNNHPFIGTGCAVIFGGILLSWISVAILYAFGHLVENSDKQVKQNQKIIQLLKWTGEMVQYEAEQTRIDTDYGRNQERERYGTNRSRNEAKNARYAAQQNDLYY